MLPEFFFTLWIVDYDYIAKSSVNVTAKCCCTFNLFSHNDEVREKLLACFTKFNIYFCVVGLYWMHTAHRNNFETYEKVS